MTPEYRQTNTIVNITDITPRAAAVLLAGTRASIEVTKEHARMTQALVLGLCGSVGIIAALILAVGILSGWDPWALSAASGPAAIVTLRISPSAVGWLSQKLGG